MRDSFGAVEKKANYPYLPFAADRSQGRDKIKRFAIQTGGF